MIIKMDKLFNFIGGFLGLNKVNEGYIGLTSFEPPIPDRIKRPELPEDDEPVAKTSFTGMLRRIS